MFFKHNVNSTLIVQRDANDLAIGRLLDQDKWSLHRIARKSLVVKGNGQVMRTNSLP